MMNLLHLSAGDILGGAAQATYQIHTLLRGAGHRSLLAVRRKDSSDPDVVQVGARPLRRCSWPERIERIQSRLAGGYKVSPRPFCSFNRNLAPAPDWESALKAMPNPDVVFLHWITHLMTVADIRRLADRVGCPIVWVLLDMEPMTGGCHYPGACTRFHDECKECPQLQTRGRHDWAGRTWHEKRRQLVHLPLTFLAPTKWLRERLAQSGLFREHAVEHIPLPVNFRMKPMEKTIARQILGLPINRKIILAGSHNLKEPRKGMDRLIAAAKLLQAQENSGNKTSLRNEDILFLLIGDNAPALAAELPFLSHNAGYIRNDIELSLTYQAADVFACPSLEDAGPMMISQAMRCGTPVVAFDTGIAAELIVTGKNGYMAKLGDVEDFATGIGIILGDDGTMGYRAAEIASRHHDSKHIAYAYGRLLEKLVLRTKESTMQ